MRAVGAEAGGDGLSVHNSACRAMVSVTANVPHALEPPFTQRRQMPWLAIRMASFTSGALSISAFKYRLIPQTISDDWEALPEQVLNASRFSLEKTHISIR